jgi:hypothetical protein
MNEGGGKLQLKQAVSDKGGNAIVRLNKPLKAQSHVHGAHKSWEDY